MPSSPIRRLDSGSREPVGPEDSGSKPQSKLSSPRGPGSCSPRSAGHFSAKHVVGLAPRFHPQQPPDPTTHFRDIPGTPATPMA